jgi:uncharacterized protein (TIGR00645 family)
MAGNFAERSLERTLFTSRWLLAPIYLGLVVSLVMLVIIFLRELAEKLPKVWTMSPDDGILSILTLIDMSLAGNLLLIVLFSGYENFVSKLHVEDEADRPDWMGTVDFSGLKLKLIASIVAISGIHLLKVFMSLGEEGGHAVDQATLMWMVVIHITFVVSGVLLALMDWVSSRSVKH